MNRYRVKVESHVEVWAASQKDAKAEAETGLRYCCDYRNAALVTADPAARIVPIVFRAVGTPAKVEDGDG